MAWRDACPANDFAAVAPSLAEVLRLTREVAAAKAAALTEGLGGLSPSTPRGEGKVSPYDALLDQWEPGASGARIDALFADLAAFLPGFLERALAHQAHAPALVPLAGPFPIDAQRELGRRLMAALGFDFAHGRLDVSLHPFCGGVPDDVRITTRYDESDFSQSLMGVLHETGHALYERGLPHTWRRQPVGRARGMAMHESQSLLVEMQACRSREFVAFVAPLAAEAFALDPAAADPDNLHRHYTKVERGFIRVDADEATYPLHVILRYRLERALIAGDLAVADLPGAWNDDMRELVGVVPPTDTLGCLQDIHWYDGAFGYFPTYTMGALAAAQLFAAARAARPEIPQALRRGDFAPLLGWLGEHVHGQGSLPANTDELLERATGRPLATDTFKRHLEARYLA
jgi:carboxypeptidase Taq